LPFVEQDNLYRGIDFTVHYSTQPGVTSKRIPVFVCPREINDKVFGSDSVFGNKHWMLNYAVNSGSWAVLTKPAMQGGNGAFGSNLNLAAAHFTDGMSNTLAMAEVKGFTPRVSGSPSTLTFAAPLAPSSPDALLATPPFGLTGMSLAAFDPTRFTHVEWVDGKVHETGFTTTFTPNTIVSLASGGVVYDIDFISATESNAGDTYAAVTSRSYHAGVVNVLLMDGSARSVANSISLTTWRALGTRAGGEVVGDY
jgi:hypothetical protein